MRTSRVALVTGFFLAAFGQPAHAQNWPTRPMTMVIPFPAGSGADVLGRIFATRLSELLGRQVVIDNVSGAGGMLAASRVAKAAPDGYQFVLGGTATHAQNQLLRKNPPYDAATDFTPVALIAEQPLVLVARSNLPVGDLAQFIAYAKTNQSTMQFGSGGVGSATHLACALLNLTIGINVTHVPYRAAIQAMQEMIAGRIDYGCPLAAPAIPLIKGRQVKAIAILSKERSPTLPDVASATEQGIFNVDSDNWNAFFLPKGAPQSIVQKLHAASIAAADTPDVQERLKDIGVTIVARERRSSAYLQKFVEQELARWAAAIKAAGIAPN